MKQPRINPAFDKAADKLAVWRNQQKLALTETQRQEYEKLQFVHNERLRDHSAKFHEREVELINEEKRRLLLEKADLALQMLPSRQMKEGRARALAQQTVNQRHEIERQTIEQRQLEERDAFLHKAAQERAEQQQQHTQEKSREPAQEPANNNPADSPLAAALKARAAQKAADRNRGDRDRER